MLWLAFLIAALSSLLLVGGYRSIAQRKAWVDEPNLRSSHVASTPRGGGIVILLLVYSYLIFQYLTGGFLWLDFLLLQLPVVIGLIGFIDDILSLPSLLRLCLYFATACWLVVGFAPLQPEQSGMVLFQVWGVMLVNALVITWFINLFNFMDGINGLAGFEFAFVVAAVFLLMDIEVDAVSGLFGVAVGAVMGFLYWNFPSGKVFLGDVGSTFLAALLAWFMLYSVNNDHLSLWVWVILLAVFVTDASYTLIVRMVRRQPWLSAHRSHAYQILSRRLNSHTRVTLIVLALNVCWLLPLAWLASRQDLWGGWIAVLAYCPLLWMCWKLEAGVDNG